ncbi:MAG TPA: acetyltransferase [Candidatus Limnocylindrales bacterium]|nr:acetyltransferase [Candidatus Limnocylindrales bacterium]
MQDLVIIGAGGFGVGVSWMVEQINDHKPLWNMIGFIDGDQSKHGLTLNGYPVIGDFDHLKFKGKMFAVCAISNTKHKKVMAERATALGLSFANLIHPNALLSKHIEVGVGNIICIGSILTVNIIVKNHVFMNLSCTVGHDVIIDNYCTFGPSVNISGNVVLEEGCEVGANAAIIPGKTIGKWSMIGAGAVVASDLPAYSLVAGVPAKPIKYHDKKR